MCNDFGNRIPYSAHVEEFSHLRIPVRFPVASPNLEPRDDIWPTETAPAIRQTDDGIEFAQLRWGFAPAKAKGPPVINFRSEGRRFPKGRCVVPASHFFEFTGTKAPKSKWKFTKTGEEWFCFAGLWRPMPDGMGSAFTLLTTARPGRGTNPQPPDGRVGAVRLARLARLSAVGGSAPTSAAGWQVDPGASSLIELMRKRRKK